MKNLLITLLIACPFMTMAQAPAKDSTTMIYNSKHTVHKTVNKPKNTKNTMYLVKDSTAVRRTKTK